MKRTAIEKPPMRHLGACLDQARAMGRRLLHPKIADVVREVAEHFSVEMFGTGQHVRYVADDALTALIADVLESGREAWIRYAVSQGRLRGDARALVRTAFLRHAKETQHQSPRPKRRTTKES